jgi:hypothetical protein
LKSTLKQIPSVEKHDFDILKDWEVMFEGDAEYKGQCTVSDDPKTPKMAMIYLWPKDSPEPEDFMLHEFLHIALTAWSRLPRRKRRKAEERLVRDICWIFRGKPEGEECEEES